MVRCEPEVSQLAATPSSEPGLTPGCATPSPALLDRGPGGEAPSLTAVVVSYNVRNLLEPCLRSLVAALGEVDEPGHLVVVDNNSEDGSAALVRERFPSVTLIANQVNAGFGAACNQVLPLAGDLLLILNPDAELGPGALPALVRRLRSNRRVGLAGPRLRYPDGAPQPSRHRFPTPAVLLVESTPLEWRWPHWPHLARYAYQSEPDVAGPVGWVSGACLLARTKALRQVGGFDPQFFMYFEEVDLARRLRAYGWETWYESAALVVHHHSQSADQDLAAKDRRYFASKYRFAHRYFGATIACALRVAGGLSFAAEWAIQAIRRDRALRHRYASLTRWHFTMQNE